jgi:hypothetical protein
MRTQTQNPGPFDYIAGGMGIAGLGIMFGAQTLFGTVVGLGVLIAANGVSLIYHLQPHAGHPPALRRSRHQQYA